MANFIRIEYIPASTNRISLIKILITTESCATFLKQATNTSIEISYSLTPHVTLNFQGFFR